jgi:RHS repeat-associated protein
VRWKGRWLAYTANPGTANEIDLYDMRARWWCPQAGVFVQIDNFAYDNPRATLWGWWSQNPVRWSDPSGHYIGQKFTSPEEAGVDAVHDADAQSVLTDTEFGGWIIQNPDGTFSATLSNLPTKDGSRSVNFGPPPTVPMPSAAGRWHTHAACKASADNGEDFSLDDMTIGMGDLENRDQLFPSYLGTPSGAVLYYDPPPDYTPAMPSSESLEPGNGPTCNPAFCGIDPSVHP